MKKIQIKDEFELYMRIGNMERMSVRLHERQAYAASTISPEWHQEK